MKSVHLVFACLLLSLSFATAGEGLIEPGRQVFLNTSELNEGASKKELSAKDEAGALAVLQGLMEGSANKRLNQSAHSLKVTRTHRDKLGHAHTKVRQEYNGLPIVGAQMIVHTDAKGVVHTINGIFAKTEGLAKEPTIQAEVALKRAMAQADIAEAAIITKPELAYVMDEDGQAFLAWKAEVSYQGEEIPMRDVLYADATGQQRFERHPQHHSGKQRFTFDAENVLLSDPEIFLKLPGTLKRVEGQDEVEDVEVNNAHNYAGVTYDYYKNVFGRDSFDNAGAPLVSSVHLDVNLNNAFWTGGQMVYGDGDGVWLLPLSGSLDVVAHELTHAVTQYESGLIYFSESGALNEALSDIFGVAAGVYHNGGLVTEETWLQGDDIFTPGIPGDAFRYMNNPTRDGWSRDYYPQRYIGPWDNGGVHLNSGIANLAFVLLVEGGTHPRGVTDVQVAALGIEKAEQIFYRAQTTYLTESSNFEAAREATASAAADLYGAEAQATVHDIWDAVGVPRTWRLNECYKAGRTVAYQGVAYRSLQAHCAYAPNWNPGEAPALWVRIAPATTGEWTVNTEYVLGASVTYEGAEYRCISGHTSVEGWEPANAPTLWEAN